MLIKLLDVQDYDSATPGCLLKTFNPSWEDIEKAVRSLDNKKRSSMGLEISEDFYMAIGGGNGEYICQVFPDMCRLLNPEIPEDSTAVKLLVVGQKSEYWAGECVPLELVLKAAKYYWETGKMAESLTWDKYA
jgi:hypothetical protein